jgi:hypothetical protein
MESGCEFQPFFLTLVQTEKGMKKLIYIVLAGSLIGACQDHESAQPGDLTGKESTYPLMAGSAYPISGTVTFKEKTDGAAVVTVELSGTDGDIQMPVHLHLGNTATPDAEVAALLTPVTGKTGLSETILTKLADETPITYQQLIALDACIKVHLAEAGPDKNIILAAGDIGKAVKRANSGRLGVGVCKSE